MLHSDFENNIKALLESSESWLKKYFTGDKTPNTITPQREDTGEETGEMYVRYKIWIKQRKVEIQYRHKTDPLKWTTYVYLPFGDNDYSREISKWVADRARNRVRIRGGKKYFID